MGQKGPCQQILYKIGNHYTPRRHNNIVIVRILVVTNDRLLIIHYLLNIGLSVPL